MKRLSPREIERALFNPDFPSFAELIDRLPDQAALSDTRIRDMVSGLRRVAKALGRPPEDVPSDPRWLQPRLAKISPAAFALSPKAWQNVVSDARAALVHFGLVEPRNRRRDDHMPAWRQLWDIVLASGDPTLQPSLSRFVSFLSRAGIEPEDVDAGHALTYRDGLAANEISKDPDRAYRAAVNGWNLAVKRIPDWPRTTLSLPSRKKVVRPPAGIVPQSLYDELESYFERRANPDPMAEDDLRALRPASIKQYRRLIYRLLGHVVAGGVDPAKLTALEALIDPALIEVGLRRLLATRGNKTTNEIFQTAFVIVGIAKSIGAEAEVVDRLGRMARKLSVPRQKGLTEKNRSRLRVLQDDRQLDRLLDLPEKLFASTKGRALTFSKGLEREIAVAISILQHCPVRVKNLAQIHLERDLQRPGNGRGYIVFSEDDVKNARPIEFELPAPVLAMIDRHLATRPASLCPAGTPWLFPRRDGSGPVDENVLATRLTKKIRKETGIVMNAHLFRHLAAMILLDAHPGAYESAKRLLGHSSTSHTISVYTGMETRVVTHAFADLVTNRRRKKP